MNTYCIEVKRELEEKEILFMKSQEKPTDGDILDFIRNEGFIFHDGFDEFNCYQVK